MPMYHVTAKATCANSDDVSWVYSRLRSVLPELATLGWNVNLEHENGPAAYSVTAKALFFNKGEAQRVRQEVNRILGPVITEAQTRNITFAFSEGQIDLVE